jgi:hypothetical protein
MESVQRNPGPALDVACHAIPTTLNSRVAADDSTEVRVTVSD